MAKYAVQLSDTKNYETYVEADSFEDACSFAEQIDWDYLIEKGHDQEVDAQGLQVEEVEEPDEALLDKEG